MKIQCLPGDKIVLVCVDDDGRPINVGVTVDFGAEFLTVKVHSPQRCADGKCDEPVVNMRNKAFVPEPKPGLKITELAAGMISPENFDPAEFIATMKEMGFTVLSTQDLMGVSDTELAEGQGLPEGVKPN